MNQSYSDQQLTKMICGNKHERNHALQIVYKDDKLKRTVYRTLSNMGALEQDIWDIFQEAIITFDRNVREGKFNEQSTMLTYITAIAKWTFLGEKRKHNRTDYEEDMTIYHQLDLANAERMLIKQEQKEVVQNILNQVDEKCKQLLTLYILNTSMKKIAELRSFSNVQSAKNAVHRCRLKLRHSLKNSPLLHQLKNEN